MTAIVDKPWLDVTLDLATNDPDRKDKARAKLYWVQVKCSSCHKAEMHRVMAAKFDQWIKHGQPELAWPTLPPHILSITTGICTSCRKYGPKMHYLIVTGSRTFPNINNAGELFFRQMVFQHWNLMNQVPMTIVHGACASGGADTWAMSLQKTLEHSNNKLYKDISFKEFPADWNRQLDGSYNKKAGFERNEEMVNWVSETVKLSEFSDGPYHTAHAMAFHYRGSAGTADCLKHIIRVGINYDHYSRF